MYLLRPDKTLGRPPVTLLWLPAIDSPIPPIPLFVFRRGVQEALPVIDSDGKVLVHCLAGIHRSPAMACCILIAKGYSWQESVELVESQRAAARPGDAYILARIKRFEHDWNSRRQHTLTADIHVPYLQPGQAASDE